ITYLMKNRQRRFPLSYQRFATIVKMFCHGFRVYIMYISRQMRQTNGKQPKERMMANETATTKRQLGAATKKTTAGKKYGKATGVRR
ncbi:hypothetical protein, partial [Geobacillus stearothermophilus]|nr:hypothetical protein [Geobacillus stearothermophilus]